MAKEYRTINTIQQSVLVKRIAVSRYGGISFENIYPYDSDNLYPEKCRAAAQRSGSLTTALNTLSRFIVGQGFTNYNNIEINENGDTLLDLLRSAAAEYARFGVAWHIKYNVFGHIASVEQLLFEQVRVCRDGRLAVRADWSEAPYADNVTVYCNAFNPENILAEFETAGGWEKHTGQILYFHNSQSIYPLAQFDSVLDDAQVEAEAKIYSLSNLQNGFSGGGVLKFPKTLNTDTEQEEAKSQINDLRSGKNAGNIIAVGLQPSQMEKEFKMWESFTVQNVDVLFQNTRTEAKKNIFELFQQPGIINGRSDSGMFNEASMRDAFAFYNSVTESQRADVANIFDWVFAPLKFEIVPLDFIVNQTTQANG